MEDSIDLFEPFYIPRDVPRLILKSLINSIYKIEVSGLENVPLKGGGILVCNHTDNLDVLVQGTSIDRKIVFLGKYELFNPQEPILKIMNQDDSPLSTPILSPVKLALESGLNALGDVYSKQLKKWGSMPIIRASEGMNAKTALDYYEKLENYICDILRSGEIVSIYPEGTRTETGVMGPFKAMAAKLAIRANVPLIPSGISGAWRMSSPQAFLTGAAFKTKITYNVGNIIPPEQFPKESEKKAAKMLTEELEKRVYYLTSHWERRGQSRRFATVL
ncbi:MAG: 1-acyl-sn-glycerol-3-phosphate acyltransferase [Leptospiraceae bacterium]|nr:1-acyl-sn-glycerol-3-phosphate acyltransferase [Leptospiraceae bacterium]